ncbi:MAG: site-specific integrase [Phycisphaera sp.]|nr:MAG: site-specific integrase [Phycisphaera sp.]
MQQGHIDPHNYGVKLQHELRRLCADETLSPEHRRTIIRYVQDNKSGRAGGRGAKKRVSDGRCLKLIYHLRRFAMEVPVPFEEIKVEHVESFVLGIEDGTIRKLRPLNGTWEYTHDTVLDYKKIIRRFLGWLVGRDTAKHFELTGWIDTSTEDPELKTFGLDMAERLANATGSTQGQALIMLMFDGGFRPTELLNVRLNDIRFEPDGEGMDTLFVRIRYSKTKPRTISLPLATEPVRRWIERHPDGGFVRRDGTVDARDPSATLVTMKYQSIRKLLSRLGKSVLGERLYPYRFRHASATFYAMHLTEYQACARFGWVMGSKAVRRYVDHSGVLAADTASLVRASLSNQPAQQNTQEVQNDERQQRTQRGQEQRGDDHHPEADQLGDRRTGDGVGRLLGQQSPGVRELGGGSGRDSDRWSAWITRQKAREHGTPR